MSVSRALTGGRWRPSGFDFALQLVGGCVAGLLLVQAPEVVAAAAVVGFVVLVVLLTTLRHSAAVLSVVPALVVLAGMKFRTRAADATLSGAIDAQIVFELGLYAVLGLVSLSAAVACKTSLTREHGSELWLYGYAAFTAISTFWSVSPAFTAVRGAQTAVLVLTAVVFLSVAGIDRALSAATTGYVVVVLLATALALTFPWARGGVEDYFSQSQRFGWFRDHPITVSMHAGTAAVLLLGYVLVPKDRRSGGSPARLVAGLLLPALVGIMVMTGSRAPLGALMAAGAGMMALRYLSHRQALAVAFVGVSLALFGGLVGATPIGLLGAVAGEGSSLITFAQRGADASNLLSMGGRLELWAFGLGQWLERPLTGFGFLASRGPILEYAPWAGHAHNGILQSVLDLGPLGAALLWVPTVLALAYAVLMRSAPGLETRIRLIVVGALIFLVLSSLTDPSLAGPPGMSVFVAFLCILFTDRLRAGALV